MERNLETPLKPNEKESVSQKLLAIQPSPFLDKLGYGTCVNVWKLQGLSNNSTRSPWAIKNVRRNVSSQLSIKYQSLLNQEANILKTLSHTSLEVTCNPQMEEIAWLWKLGGESLGNLTESRLENDFDFLCDDSFSNFEDSETGLDSSCVSDEKQNYGTCRPLPLIELGLEYASAIDAFHACTEQDHEQRPSAAELVDWLQDLINKLRIKL